MPSSNQGIVDPINGLTGIQPMQGFNQDLNTSTSGSTTENTSTTGIDTEGMQYILNTLLAGNGGLAATAEGEKTAGLYDSSTNQLLQDTLLTQSAGYAASKNVTTTGSSATNNTATGSVLGGVGSAAGSAGSLLGATVICTELWQRGINPTEDHYAAAQWSARNVSSQMLRGYHFWAIPYVRLMKKSKFATALFIPIVLGRNEWILRGNKSIGGFIALKILAPLSVAIGYFVSEQKPATLYTHDEVES